jgi:hypothetical protein
VSSTPTNLLDIFPTLGTDGVYVGLPLADHGFPGLPPEALRFSNGDQVIASLILRLQEFYTPERRETHGTPIVVEPGFVRRIDTEVIAVGTTLSTRQIEVKEFTIKFHKELPQSIFLPTNY